MTPRPLIIPSTSTITTMIPQAWGQGAAVLTVAAAIITGIKPA
jgi:hypothetical protein